MSGTKLENTMVLQGRHPYMRGREASLVVEILRELPGPLAERGSPGYSVRKFQGDVAWTHLAGPYLPEMVSRQGVGDFDLLMGLLWDLRGEPLCDGGRRRPSATFCIVRPTPGAGLEVYRLSCECRDAFDESEKVVRADFAEEGCGIASGRVTRRAN